MKTTSAAPERIGLYGIEGSGKTKAIAEISAQYRQSDTPGTFHWITAEPNSITRLSDGYPDFWDNNKMHKFAGWVDLRSVTTEVLSLSTDADWICVENSDRYWQLVRDTYDEYRAKRDGIQLHDMFEIMPPDEDRGRWDRINPEYYRWFDSLWGEGNPAHLMMTAPQTQVVLAGPKSKWEDSKDLQALYLHHGFRPDTQKAWSARMHTVLWMQRPRVGEWTMTSIKDRERELLQDAPVLTFPMSYLLRVGGWEL